MGRSPCCSKQGLNRGAWTALEDKILTSYIKAHGEGKWRSLPKRAAGRLPGRTDNEIKNYWNTTLGKKAKGEPTSTGSSKETSPPPTKSRAKRREIESKTTKPSAAAAAATRPPVIRTKATRLTKIPSDDYNQTANASSSTKPSELQAHQTQDCTNNLNNNYGCTDEDDDIEAKGGFCNAFQSLPLDEAMINATWTGGNDCDLEDYGATLI
ncbi:hypothetical protein GBA52_028376 [Prunus armeniaca]|nr:hypothetical protein GBA52_028376 [Prunus armeniaca]